jgi:hypothetical protein
MGFLLLSPGVCEEEKKRGGRELEEEGRDSLSFLIFP